MGGPPGLARRPGRAAVRVTQPITIRPAGMHDVPAIQRIYNREVLDGVATLDEWPWSDARRRAWLETSRDEIVLVAQGQEAVLGFAYCTPMQKFGFRFTREVTVYVDRDYHRGGVGRQLVEALIAGARARDLHVLIARITAENTASLALFAALGFERSALRKEFGYKHGRWIDIVEMQRVLQRASAFEARIQPGFRVRVVRTPAEMQEALAIRRAVFMAEQRRPANAVSDRYDGDPATVADAVQVLGRLDGRPVATGRILLDPPEGQYPRISHVAVRREQRRRYWGVATLAALHDEAHRRGSAGVTLAAPADTVGFFARLGYVPRGGLFLDAGIEHRWMDCLFADAEH